MSLPAYKIVNFKAQVDFIHAINAKHLTFMLGLTEYRAATDANHLMFILGVAEDSGAPLTSSEACTPQD